MTHATRFRSSIEWRLPAMVFGLLMLVTVALAWLAYLQVRRSADAAAAIRLESITTGIASQSAQQQVQSKQQLRRLAADGAVPYFRTPPGAGRSTIWAQAIAPLASRDSSVIANELLDVKGGRLESSDTVFSGRVSAQVRDDARRDAEGRDSAAIGTMIALRDTIVYPIVAVVSDPSGRLGFLVQWHRVRLSPKAHTQVETLFGEGAAMSIGSIPGVWTDQSTTVTPPPIDTTQLGKPFRYVRDGQGERLAVATRIPGAPWYMVLEFPERMILAPTRQFLNQITLVSAGVLALALVLAWLLSRHITGPLRELTFAADARATGEYSARVPVHGVDELGRLATAFNSMADHVNLEVEGRRASEEQWRLLFRSNPHPMYVYDDETLRFLAVNDATVAKYGYGADEFAAMTLRDIRPPDEAERLMSRLAQPLAPNETGGIWKHMRKDGTTLDVQIDANSLVFNGRAARLVLAQDVTEQRRLENQLRQAQRMEAVGRLAGGVAHDFNNLLLVIMTYSQLLHDNASDGDPAKDDLASILAAVDRAQTLTRQLLALSRQQVLQPVVIDPNDTLRKVEGLLRRVIGEDIQVRTELTRDVGVVLVDPGQLEQVLLNLAVNARDAMPSGGRLTVATTAVDLDDRERSLHGVHQAGRYVIISVADTGIGMNADVRARIFDPFFTTKEVGKGTGLGLAIVYGIVTQSGGAITVYSEPGMGSTFRVYLPRVDAPDTTAAIAPPAPPVSGTEVVLLVEDEPTVRVATLRALQHLGYTVMVAGGGAEALELVARHTGPLDLVISDVVMPEMDGPTLVARLREQHPGLKALLVSGYSSEAVTTRGFANASALFLQKPFSMGVLSRKIRAALEGRTTSFT